MARGRPRLSPEAKAAKKAKDDAANAQSLAADALLQFPREPEKLREEFIEIPGSLRADKEKAAAAMATARSAIKEHGARQARLYKVEPKALKMFDDVFALPDGRRQRVIRQFNFLVKTLGLDSQLDLFNETAAAGGAEPDEGSAFDKTAAGAAVGAERGDDPGRASKRRGPPAPPAATTPNVGAEGLAAGIKQLESPEEKRARINDQKSADAAVFDKVGTSQPEAKNMTPAQKRAEAKRIAEEVFAKGREKDDGAEAPGTYRVQ